MITPIAAIKYHQYGDNLALASAMAKLKEKGIPTAIYYPLPLHQQEAFNALGYNEGDFPISEKVAGEIFSVPMHPYLAKEDQDMIIETIRS